MKTRKQMSLCAACVYAALLLGGCKVDVNSLASSQAAVKNASATDTEARSEVFYRNDTDTASQAEKTTDTASSESSETETDSDIAAFDESKYLTMFVSGGAKIPLTADALYGSEQVGELKCGDRVSVVRRDVMEYCFVYSAELAKFGYIRTEYLADYLEETTVGDVYYIKPAQAQVYSDIGFTETLETVSMNDMLTVIVKRTDGKWRVADKNGKIGYIDKGLLSEKRVSNASSKAASSKTVSSKTASTASESASSKTVSSKTVSSAVSSEEEKEESGLYTGKGSAPEEYTTYIVDVDVGYLSLRSSPSAKSKVIGELYYEERVYVLDTSGDYWYIYAPSLGMYGYVTGDYNYLYPEYYDD